MPEPIESTPEQVEPPPVPGKPPIEEDVRAPEEPILEQPAPFPSGATLVKPMPSGASPVSDIPAGEVAVDEEPPGVGDKIVERFLGTDVEDDPLLFPRLGTTIAGGIAGGIAGAKGGAALGTLGGPFAPTLVPILGGAGLIIGGGIGAFGGAQAPELAIEGLEELGVVEEGTREKVGLSPEELRTVAEGEALLDMATGGTLAVARLGGRFIGRVVTGSKTKVVEQAARQGIDLLPVQSGDRIIGRGFVTVFGRFPLLGGGAIRRRGLKAEGQLKKVISGLVNRTGPITDQSELGVKIFADAKSLVKETNKYFGAKYKAIFAQADEFDVRITPNETLTKADEILKKIAKETPTTIKGKPTSPGKALKIVARFIKKEILPLRRLKAEEVKPVGTGVLDARGKEIVREQPPLLPGVKDQSLAQIDGLITKIDQEIASIEPGQKRFALTLLKQLRQAAQADTIANIKGVNADEIARGLKELDTEFSQTMSQLFETATAKRFGSVEKRGLRAIEFDRTTRTPVDQLARIVINLESPQAMDELSRLVSPETLRTIAAKTIDDAMQMALKSDGFVNQLDIEIFAKRLGLDGTNEARKRVVQRMLEKSGSDITPQDLDDIVTVGRVLAGFDIPNVSSFIARRGAIGGIQGVLNGVVPGLALMGGAGAAVAYSGVPVIGAILLVGGSHMFARVISSPAGARALHKVFDKESTAVIRRKATIELLRAGIEGMRDLGEISQETFFDLADGIAGLIDAMDEQIRSMGE